MKGTPSVNYLCRQCEWRLEAKAGHLASVPCENCGTDNGVVAPPPNQPISRCGFCSETELYVQKDFNRATGIALVVVGAIFVPWTYGLSLLFVTILDFIVYYMVGDVVVCYECQSVHRNFPENPAFKPFDLVLHDRHVYGEAPPGAEELEKTIIR